MVCQFVGFLRSKIFRLRSSRASAWSMPVLPATQRGNLVQTRLRTLSLRLLRNFDSLLAERLKALAASIQGLCRPPTSTRTQDTHGSQRHTFKAEQHNGGDRPTGLLSVLVLSSVVCTFTQRDQQHCVFLQQHIALPTASPAGAAS